MGGILVRVVEVCCVITPEDSDLTVLKPAKAKDKFDLVLVA